MSIADLVAEALETLLRFVPIPARTGLRAVGRPGRESPVFLTGNYDLTVRRVLRALRGQDAWLVVASSRGINVWCAASGGHLGTHQVVTALKLARLEERVVHREIILPQLAATGVEGKEVRRRTGWIVRFGPARAADIGAYLAAGKQKSEPMRRVEFGSRERLEMAAAWATPISVLGALVAWRHLAGALALVWGTALLAFLTYDRLPLAEGWRRPALGALLAAATSGALAASGDASLGRVAAWGLAAIATLCLVTFDFAGSSPTAVAGAFEERLFRVALDRERCSGAYTCWAVCPEAVFEQQPAERKVEIARAERCIRCGACIVQCPQDALAFETGDGRRIPPETIRRFKLNMLGKRSLAGEAADLEAAEAGEDAQGP